MRINKAVAAVVGAVVLLALCAGTALLVTNSANNHNLAVQRAAATASHNRAVASASAATQARAITAAQVQAARAEKAAKAASKAANRPNPAPAPPVVAAPAGLAPCGNGTQGEEVYAGADTSCPFALNVESDYAQGGYWNESGTAQFYSYSPVTGQSYLMMSNSAGNPVVVTGGNGALVQFDY